MTTTFQPGQHPDADQLSAFVEHALPLHQQQATLAHLATCADCRAIVFLAQSSIPEELTLPLPVAAHRPWFSSWMIAFPAAAALAGLVLVTIHLHNAAVANQSAAPVTTAHTELSPPLTPPPPAEPATSPKPAPSQEKKPQAAPLAPPTHTLAIATPAAAAGARSAPQPQVLNGSLEGRSLASLSQPATGASFTAANPAPPPAAAPPASLPSSAPQPALSSGGSARMPLHSSASQYDSARARTQQAASTAAPSQGVYGGTGSTNLNQAYVAGIAAAAAPAPASTDETVTVTNAAPLIDTADAVTLQTRILPKLPSKLPALSIAANARQQLAIDTAGMLFRSEDAGVTWQPVPVQWTGRAVKVALLTAPSAHFLAKSAGALAAPPAAASTSSTPPPTFQLITGDGGLWVSADGQTWKRK
jgi:hypothetical protein